jgi:LPXTG-motif cell wall-anchored protein
VKNVCAVVVTAAIVLTATGAPAAAQRDGMINISGLFYVDRNGDNAYDAGDGIRAWGPGVRITNQDTKQSFTAPVGADGRYEVHNLPKGPTYVVENLDIINYPTTKLGFNTTETVTNGDFPLRGFTVRGLSFVDANGDGVKQADEKATTGSVKVSGTAQDGSKVDAEATPAAGGEYVIDMPIGDFTLTSPNLTGEGLALAKPKAATDIDWVSGTRELTQNVDNRTQRLDLRYFAAKADIAVEAAISPVKDVYVLGEQIDAKIKLLNKGDVPVAPSFVMSYFDAKLISHSGNITVIGRDDYALNHKILPGGSAEVVIKFEPASTEFDVVWPLVRFNYGGLLDVDRKNNGARIPVKVVEKSTTTDPTTPLQTTTTTAPTTTTTTQPAAVKAGNKSGLASTGASPLGAIALGGLLLVAGVGAFVVARRRRS